MTKAEKTLQAIAGELIKSNQFTGAYLDGRDPVIHTAKPLVSGGLLHVSFYGTRLTTEEPHLKVFEIEYAPPIDESGEAEDILHRMNAFGLTLRMDDLDQMSNVVDLVKMIEEHAVRVIGLDT